MSVKELNNIFEKLANWLDIPDSHFERAEQRYQSVGEWLNRDKSFIAQYEPSVFPQGSIRLGTVIKPLSNEDEYDIDLVCKLNASKEEFSQKTLKNLVGLELDMYVEAHNMASPKEERRRSWRMNYADTDVRFHLDVLPAIPENLAVHDESIAITDNQSHNFAKVSSDWPCSNPIDYAHWFTDQMRERREAMLKAFAESLQKSIEQVPDYKIKTPLQRSIQLLKRHRDIVYDGHPDDKPISIIITTLAAQAYDNGSEIVESLLHIIEHMEDYIEVRNGIYWVANPVNSQENFADKWDQYPERKDAFFEWLNRVQLDITSIFNETTITALSEKLEQGFGKDATRIALSQVFPKSAALQVSSNNTVRFNVTHKQKSQWPMVLDHEVAIDAKITVNGFRQKNLVNDGNPVMKKSSLTFTAITNVEKPYDVYWQVVNTGYEAELANAKRGEFYDSGIHKGRKVRTESTQYKGMHWVQCFVVKSGVCVARSREFVVNIS
ncbi:MAG: nucleotidyltransferase [Caldilineaceae bacterium]